MSLSWYGDSVMEEINGLLATGLDEAGQYLVQAIRDRIGIQGPPPSRPGEPPHRVTGALQASYTHTVDAGALDLFIISDSPYALPLEIGSGRVAARPAVQPVISESGAALERLMSR